MCCCNQLCKGWLHRAPFTDWEFRAMAMMERASGLMRANVRLSMSTLVSDHLQYFPSDVTVTLYVCHILGHSVCLPSTWHSISAFVTTCSAMSDFFDKLIAKQHWTFCTEHHYVLNGRILSSFATRMLFKFWPWWMFDACLWLWHLFIIICRCTYNMCTLLVPQMQLLSCLLSCQAIL